MTTAAVLIKIVASLCFSKTLSNACGLSNCSTISNCNLGVCLNSFDNVSDDFWERTMAITL